MRRTWRRVKYFDGFEVNSERRLLPKKGLAVSLEPKAFDLLLTSTARQTDSGFGMYDFGFVQGCTSAVNTMICKGINPTRAV
jgi:hypothetical protein